MLGSSVPPSQQHLRCSVSRIVNDCASNKVKPSAPALAGVKSRDQQAPARAARHCGKQRGRSVPRGIMGYRGARTCRITLWILRSKSGPHGIVGYRGASACRAALWDNRERLLRPGRHVSVTPEVSERRQRRCDVTSSETRYNVGAKGGDVIPEAPSLN